MALFYDRVDAGIKLAYALREYHDSQAVVCALPRGGVIIGAQIARILHLPIDVLIARKIGAPDNPEYAIAAVTEYGPVIANPREVNRTDSLWFFRQVEEARRESRRRRLLYSRDHISPRVTRSTAIVVDNGAATGLTIIAALADLKRYQPHDIIVAVPVITRPVADRIKKYCRNLIALHIVDDDELSVGNFYDRFNQVTDFEVMHALFEVQEEVGRPTSRLHRSVA